MFQPFGTHNSTWHMHPDILVLNHSLTMGRSEELRKPWKGCLCLCFFVCLCVCLIPSYRPQFSTQQPNFLKMFFGTMGKKWIFRFFEIFIFDVLGPFSFFLLCLCIGHKSPHWTYKHNFWHVGSLWHRKGKFFNFFLPFLTIWGPFFDDFIEFFTLCT